MRDLELPGRSPVHACGGMAATSHALATQTAIAILRAGGNAVDAAVAACAVQCVVEPESTGIGGDCFCLFAPEGSTDIVAYNGSGRTPAAASTQWYLDQGMARIPELSPHAVTVPGAVDAWDRLVRDHGRLDLATLLQPAIDLARNGYPIASRVHADFAQKAGQLRAEPAMADTFLVDGAAPAVGSLHRQARLADTLERIAREGRDGFYKGAVAEEMVSVLRDRGGLHALEDFARAAGDYETPISAEYRGYRVFECPPNGQGIIALMLLGIMEGQEGDAGPMDVQRIHREIEAGRLAYRDRNLFLADPRKSTVPADWMLSAAHINEMRAAMDDSRRMEAVPGFSGPSHRDTVYITVVDKDRNACSFINSLFDNFGAVFMAPESGVVFHNRGSSFVIDADHPNTIAPEKRPMHTIIPAMVAKGDRVVMPFGVMGGQYQSFGHMQFLTRLLHDGLDIQQAQDAPRFFPDPFGDTVEMEGTVPNDIQEGLRQLGHQLVKPAKPVGGSQAIWIDWESNVLTGGSDPRKDGCAIGY